MKKKLIYLGAVVIVIGLAIAAVMVANRFAGKQLNSGGITNKQCQSQQQTGHIITIENDVANPTNTVARQCDTLTIINKDDETREIAFGLHENHVPYDGVAEKLLAKDQSFTVTLIQIGNFRVHDHIHDEVQATFTVNPR